MLIFGAQRQLISQQFLSTTAGGSVETELIDISNQHSPSVEVIAQMQYTQQTLFKTEIVSGSGDTIGNLSKDFNSLSEESTQKVSLPDLPSSESIKVKLSVASQSITATPPAGITPAQVPVIFEINVYRQWLNRAYLWPAFFACIGLWVIVDQARRQEATW